MTKITVAQINVRTGDIFGNLERIIKVLSKKDDSDFIIFPEMTISGYNCGDLFEKDYFISDCAKAINAIVEYSIGLPNTVIIVGGPSIVNKTKTSAANLYNSAFVIMNGMIVYKYDKQLMANDYHHEDKKYFIPGDNNKVMYLNGIKFGILICEDGWKSYDRNIQKEMKEEGAEIIFSMNCSYFTFNKLEQRERIFINDQLPMIYVNNIGIGDITKNYVCYDGNSFVYNPYSKNKINYIGLSFDTSITDLEYSKKAKEIVYNVKYYPIKENKKSRLLNAMIYSLRNIVLESHASKVQVHLSGGIDSAIVAYLAVKAMGHENVVFITQPSKNNGQVTLGNAKYIAMMLDIQLETCPIIEYIEVYKKENPKASPAQVASFEATLRKALGISYTHHNKTVLLSCGNHTENALGWNSFGDIGNYCGIVQPVGDLSKTEIFELCEYINEIENEIIIPSSLYDGSVKPAAELEDSSEDPFDYKLMSYICEKLIRFKYNPSDLIAELKVHYYFRNYDEKELIDNVKLAFNKIKISAYKRAQGSPVLVLSNRSFGFSMRDTLINHYNFTF